MNQAFDVIVYQVSIWAVPVLVAITFHEAAHGFVAHILGDDTAWRLGRVSFNPTKHIDLFGTAHSTVKCNGRISGAEENLARGLVAEYLSGES